MNSLPLPAYRQRPIKIADEESFVDVPLPPTKYVVEEPQRIVASLVGRHCVGMANRPTGKTMFAYLMGDGSMGDGEASPSIDWNARPLLNCCSVPDAMHLVVLCGIPIGHIARPVRELNVTNSALLRFLGQFADHSLRYYKSIG